MDLNIADHIRKHPKFAGLDEVQKAKILSPAYIKWIDSAITFPNTRRIFQLLKQHKYIPAVFKPIMRDVTRELHNTLSEIAR